MRIVTVSIVRNGANVVPRFVRQLTGLRALLAEHDHTLRSVVVEGDSTDDTWDVLNVVTEAAALDVALYQHPHGGPVYGSVEAPQRWRNISRTFDYALERVDRDDDVVVQLDPDLLWAPETLGRLIANLTEVDACAPMVFHGASNRWYDVWGFRDIDGKRFQAAPPYHPGGHMAALTEIGSAGGCVAVRGEYVYTARFDPPEEANVSWCRQLRAAGARLYVDPRCVFVHPAEAA